MSASPSPAIWFDRITFSDGTEISLDLGDVVVLVGPNNAGKSVALADLNTFMGGTGAKAKVIRSVHCQKHGSSEDLIRLLVRIGSLRRQDDRLIIRGHVYPSSPASLAAQWEDPLGPHRSLFCSVFCEHIRADGRIGLANPMEPIDTLAQPATHPIHTVFADDALESRLSAWFRRAFDEDLVLDRGRGNSWPFVVGQIPPREPHEDRASKSYVARLRAACTDLDKNGDGMRAFAGVILHLLAPSAPSVLLLDEPEAFLHPPQARLLGELIARERRPESQLFVATHSADVLEGLLSAAPRNLRIIRLERAGDVNLARELNSVETAKIAADPLLRFSSVLSGLFHRRVILCESDADCLFYKTLLHTRAVSSDQHPDVHFVHGGGKDRLPALASVLRDLGVRVDVIADMDALARVEFVQSLVDAVGGDWRAVQKDVEGLHKAIENNAPPKLDDLKEQIRAALNDVSSGDNIVGKLKKKIEDIFRFSSPWNKVKRIGVTAIPRGQATEQFNRIDREFRRWGLWLVQVGELEGFCRTIGGKGPPWVQKVLEEHDPETSPALQGAREFVGVLWHAGLTKASELPT